MPVATQRHIQNMAHDVTMVLTQGSIAMSRTENNKTEASRVTTGAGTTFHKDWNL